MLTTLSLLLSHLVHRLRHTFDPAHRRLLLVADDPQRASVHDLELLARAHGTPEHRIFAIVDRLAGARLVLSRVWDWTVEHDGLALADMLDQHNDYEMAELLERHLDHVQGLPRSA